MTIRLIVGLGNPGESYASTRHNVGAAFVRALAHRFDVPLKDERKFRGELGRGPVAGRDVRLLVPSTWMNESGLSVGAVVGFFKLPVDDVLVAYDEMAFEPGVVRLKTGGGDNGHNGIRSVVQSLGGDRNFHRLRIGVGHPGDKAAVTRYLTSVTMPRAERERVEDGTWFSEALLADLLAGDLQRAMNVMHAQGDGDGV